MAQYLDKTGLTTLWTKIKNTFALKKHTHKKSEITDLTIPTVNNPTITINQGGTKKGSFSLNQSGAATIDLTDNNTTYTAGTGLSLSGTTFSVSSANVSTMMNLLSEGTSDPTDNDYYISQWAGGGTTTTTYHRRPISKLYNYMKGKFDSIYQAKGSYAASSHTHDYLPLTGGTLTGNLSLKEYKNILLRPNNSSYTSGIGYDTHGNECIALWAKNSVTRLRWNAGVDMSELTSGKMMTITPDFEISKADGTAKGYIAGQQIIHSGNIGSQNVNYANSAGSANSVAWGNVTGKPGTYTPSAHYHTSLKSNTDNRNANTTPNDYNGVLNIAGLKGNDKIGLDTNIYGTYSCLIGVRGWSDSSGGDSHEIAFTGNGHIAHRHGSTTSWVNWERIAHVSDIPANYVTTDTAQTITGYKKISSIGIDTINGATLGNAILRQNASSGEVIIGSTVRPLRLWGNQTRPSYSTNDGASYSNLALLSDIPTKLPASNISMSFSNGVLTITYN